MYTIISESEVYTYDTLKRAHFIKKETVFKHFRPDVPSRIDGLIVNGSILHMFSRNYFYDASHHPMVIKPFHSRSVYNPYRSTYRRIRPNGVTAATRVGIKTFLFINERTYYLFKISDLNRGTHAGTWIKGKNLLRCE